MVVLVRREVERVKRWEKKKEIEEDIYNSA